MTARLLLACVALTAAAVFAQTPPPVPSQPSPAGPPKATPPGETKPFKPGGEPASRAAHFERLGKLLAGTKFKHAANAKEFRYTLTVGDTGEWHVDANTSANGAFVWLDFPCMDLPAAPTDGPALLLFLAENTRMGPAHFVYHKSVNRFHLQAPLPAAGLTADDLSNAVHDLVAHAYRTTGLWDNTKWTGGEAWKGGDPGAVRAPGSAGGAPAPNNDPARRLDVETFKALVAANKYVVSPEKPGPGNAGVTFRQTLKSGDEVRLAVPNEGPFVTLSVPLTELPGGTANGPNLLKLFAESGKMGTGHYAYDKAAKRVVYRQPATARGMTAESLAAEVNALLAETQRTGRLWDPENLLAPAK